MAKPNNRTVLHHKGSTLTIMALWSLFFTLALTLFSCNGEDKESDDIRMIRHEVSEMYECRIKAQNKDFYLHKYNAERIISDYEGRENDLSETNQQQLLNLKSQAIFEYVDYCLQVGKQREAQEQMAMLSKNTTMNIYSDTMQWLNYLYHTAKVLYIPYYINKNRENLQNGYDALMQCYILASRKAFSWEKRAKKNDLLTLWSYRRYEALSLQLLSRYFTNDSVFQLAKQFDPASIRYINEDNIPDSLLSTNLAERAVRILAKLDYPIYTADAWRNLAACYFYRKQPEKALDCLTMAKKIPWVDSTPDLMASINEQFSMTYAALDDKHLSDYYRNAYLDLQDSTRQDRLLEARALELKETSNRIWAYVAGAFLLFLLLGAMTLFLTSLRRRKQRNDVEREEELDELTERISELELRLSNSKRAAVEQRAQISIINGLLPLIDRMQHAIQRAQDTSASDEQKQESLLYAKELSDAIDQQNNMLTQWIKLRKGTIEPKIVTLHVQQLFDILSKGRGIYAQNGITLVIPECNTMIKADRTLMLFQLNTLMDNARKATPEGGTITLSCTENREHGFAEISITDTGKGMTEEQCQRMLSVELMSEEIRNDEKADRQQSHGFGLVNCRGIIDRYRKISNIFSVCNFSITSAVGKGTTISLRLPLAKCIMLAIMLLSQITSTPLHAADNEQASYGGKELATANEREAARLADSLYECNIQGRYADALLFADSCKAVVDNDSTIAASIRLTLYNETAVAALALHRWNTYKFNNYRFNKLYKECTADSTLAIYCQTMEQNSMKANIAMLIMILLIIALLPVFWFTYLRHIIRYRKDILNKKTALKETIARLKGETERLHLINNITDNQLSTVKHETMYYPTRIRQMISMQSDANELHTTVSYYRDLYMMLASKVLNKQVEAYQFAITKQTLDEAFPGISIYAGGNDNTMLPSNDSSVAMPSVLINEELISYLKLLLKRKNSGQKPLYSATIEGSYACITCQLPHSTIPAYAAKDIFTPQSPDTDFLIMRQIIREIGESTNRYGAGIISREAKPTATSPNSRVPRNILEITLSLPLSN